MSLFDDPLAAIDGREMFHRYCELVGVTARLAGSAMAIINGSITATDEANAVDALREYRAVVERGEAGGRQAASVSSSAPAAGDVAAESSTGLSFLSPQGEAPPAASQALRCAENWFEYACTWPDITRYEYTQWALGNVHPCVLSDEDAEDSIAAYLDAIFA